MPSTTICKSDVSFAANKLYMKNRYIPYNACKRPCTKMKIQLNYQSKVPTKGEVRFYLDKTILNSKQVKSFTDLHLVAEVGGYLGLTLGVSLLDMRICFGFLQQYGRRRYGNIWQRSN